VQSPLLKIFTLCLEKPPAACSDIAFSPAWSRRLDKVTFRGAFWLKLFSGPALGNDGSTRCCLYRGRSRKNFDEEKAVRKCDTRA